MEEVLEVPTGSAIQDLDQASLTRLVEELQKSKSALEARQFIEASLARFADVMRWRQDDSLPGWVDRLLEELMNTVNGLHAALYLVEETENNESYLRLVGSYAFTADKTHDFIRMGEGLIGQVAKSKISRYLDDQKLIGITTQSSLAQLQPAVLKIEALVYNEEIQGILEVSSIDPFREEALELMRQLSSVIAANILTIQNQERTQRLYKEMQVNAQALAIHEEEMRKNLNAMSATQKELQDAKTEIEYRQKLMERITGNVPGMLFQYVHNLVTQEEYYTYVSERSRNILYISPQEVIQSQNAITDRIHFEDKDSFVEAFRLSREQLLPLSWTGRILTPDGSYRWIRAESTPTNDTDYLIVWDGYLYEITLEKERELEQARQKQQLSLAALMAELGFIEFDFDQNSLTLSEEMRRICNLPDDANLEEFFQIIYPEDRESIVFDIQNLKQKFQPFDHEYRIQVGNKLHWIKSSGRVMNNQYNKPERALVIVQDITIIKHRAIEIEEKNRILEARELELETNLRHLEDSRKEVNDLLERQNLLFQTSRDAILILKNESIFNCNPAFLTLYGFDTKESALKVKASDLLPAQQPNGDDSVKILENLIEDCHYHGSTLWEWKNVKQDGVLFDAEIVLSHFAYQNESYIQATIRDITERKVQQAELLKRQMQLELAENLGRLGAFEINKADQAILWSRSLVDILELKEREVQTLTELRDIIHEEDREAFDQVMQRTLAGEVSSASTDYRVLMMDGSYKWMHTTVIGTYNEFWELIGLEGMSQDITNGKERENLIQRHNYELEMREELMKENLIQLEKAQKELKTVSERQSLLFETARDAILIMDGQTILDCNPAAARMFDVPNKEYLIKRKLPDLSPEHQPTGEHSATVLKNLSDQALLGANNKLEWVIQTYKGVPQDVEITMSPFIFQGRMMMQTTLRDISNRRHREREMRNQKALIESLIQSSNDEIMILDADCQVLISNAQRFRFLRADSPKIMVGQSILEFLDDDQQEVYRQFGEKALQGDSFTVDSWQDVNGQRYFYEIDFFPVRDANNDISGFSIIATDITTKKWREIELLEQEYMRTQSEEIARIGSYNFNVTTGQIKWSKGNFRIFGVDESQGTPDINYFMSHFVHEDDRQYLGDLVAKSVAEGNAVETTYRIIVEGKEKLIHSYVRPLKDGGGKVVKLLGLNHDVTPYQLDRKIEEGTRKNKSQPKEDISTPPDNAETHRQIEQLEKTIRQLQKDNKDLQSEYKLIQKKLGEFKEKEHSLLEIIQVKDQEIDQLRKKINRG